MPAKAPLFVSKKGSGNVCWQFAASFELHSTAGSDSVPMPTMAEDAVIETTTIHSITKFYYVEFLCH